MTALDYLRDKILQADDGFLESEKIIAAYYLKEDLSSSVALPIREAAARIGVSESSIVRFTRRIGYNGYRDFQTGIQKILEGTDRVFPVYDHVHCGSTTTEVIRAVSDQTIRGLNNTMSVLNTDQIVKLAGKIAESKHTLLTGLGRSAIAANGLQQRLMRIGIEAYYIDPMPRIETPIRFAAEEDCFIIFSLRLDSENVNRLIRKARHNGCFIAILTANRAMAEELAADCILEMMPEEHVVSGHTNTTITEFVISDCIYLLTAETIGTPAKLTMQKTVDAVKIDRLDHNPGQSLDYEDFLDEPGKDNI